MQNPGISGRRHTGFTLVELMIVLAILAGLAALAWPTYQNAVQRSRRADAVSALSEIVQAQERWRANNPSYPATRADLPGTRTVSHDGHYALSLLDGSVSGSSYTVRATVRSGSPQQYDATCNVMQVVAAAGNLTYNSIATGGTTNAAPDPCWAR
jgi:type IV pilus assembly protein PilE